MGLRYLTSGESHGPALSGIIDGLPAGIEITQADFDRLAEKRWAGYGRGKRKTIEDDKVEVLAGVLAGKTIGSPIGLLIKNKDYSVRKGYMHPFKQNREAAKITVPLPGHADLPGALKYGFDDCRLIRERASARETAMRTALSVPARNMLLELGIDFTCLVEAIGGVSAKIDYSMKATRIKELTESGSSAFLTPDAEVCEKWKKIIDEAKEQKRSLGGTACVIFWNLPFGLGSHTQHDKKLDAILAASIMSLPSVKGVEFGKAVALSKTQSVAADKISFNPERGIFHKTNLAAGLEGGMTNSEPMIIRFHLKPLPGAAKIDSIDLDTMQTAWPDDYRSDVQVLQAAAVVGESVIAIELASQILETTGGVDVRTVETRYRNLFK
ncbi:MAG: chorismate synthase [Candidatus Rifleibacteriota bacterium]